MVFLCFVDVTEYYVCDCLDEFNTESKCVLQQTLFLSIEHFNPIQQSMSLQQKKAFSFRYTVLLIVIFTWHCQLVKSRSSFLTIIVCRHMVQVKNFTSLQVKDWELIRTNTSEQKHRSKRLRQALRQTSVSITFNKKVFG